jgi:hypothetical protein
MTDEQMTDLKQFITTLIQQQVTPHIYAAKNELRQEIRILDVKLTGKIQALDAKLTGNLHALDKKLTGKIDNISDNIGDALDASNDVNGKQLKNHERRINILEAKAV